MLTNNSVPQYFSNFNDFLQITFTPRLKPNENKLNTKNKPETQQSKTQKQHWQPKSTQHTKKNKHQHTSKTPKQLKVLTDG